MFAVMVSGYVPLLFAAGVPLRTAVPFRLSANVSPLGNVPVWLKDGEGVPVVVTLKLAALPAMKVVLLALVIAGA